MDFHRLLQVASEKQTNLEQQKKLKPEKKPVQPNKLRKDREKGVISANVRAFMERKEREEKEKGEVERRKKEELLKKRDEVKHAKTAKAMASRTKDNLQYYTKEKLDNFVAKEKEREEKIREKEERKYQKRLEKHQLAAEGKKRKRRTKYEIAKDSGRNLEPPKPTVGVSIETKKKSSKISKPQGKPPLDFNALIRMAQAKQTNPGQPNQKDGKPEKGNSKGPGRPMTKEERERWERTHTKEYQNFLKNGGKRPDFPGVKQLKESASGSGSSRESSPAPKSISANKSSDDSKKQSSKPIMQQNGTSKRFDRKITSSNDSKPTVKRTYLKGDIRAGPSNTYDPSNHKEMEQSANRDIPSSPEAEVNETVIQCGPTKSKPALKRKPPDEPRLNPFDRIMQKYDAYRPPEKKHRHVIESDSEEEYDSEMDDFIDDGDEGNDYSSAIKEIFGYDKKKYRYEDDDVSDMETNYASIMREEARSAKIGLKEDLEDIRREEEENRMKAERRKMREKELKRMKKKGR